MISANLDCVGRGTQLPKCTGPRFNFLFNFSFYVFFFRMLTFLSNVMLIFFLHYFKDNMKIVV